MQMKKTMIIIGLCCVSTQLGACGRTVVGTGNINADIIQTAAESENVSASHGKGGQESDKADTTDETGVTAATAGAQGSALEQKNKENSAATTWNDSELEEWRQVYLDYLDTMGGAQNCAYSLIYVDDDEIPELAIDYGFDGGYARVDGGCRAVLTFHDHVLDQWEPFRSRFTYIERGNRICRVYNGYDVNEIFHSDNVYMIQDGKWTYAGGGYYREYAETSALSAKLALLFKDNDYDWKLVREYTWDETAEWDEAKEYSVSEAEYNARLDAIYPEAQRIDPQNYYFLEDICSIIRTGKVASAGHRYELIVEEVTWEEASARCREKGGYLATITSDEEMRRIQEQVTAEGKTDVTFFVGAKERKWLEHGTEELDVMILYTILDFWLDGGLDLQRWQKEGEEALKNYFVLVYRESGKRCYLGEELNDILGARPSYTGKIGYICEYDSVF